MQQDIYIKEKSGGTQIRVPLLPSEIKFESGGIKFAEYSLLDLGDVIRASGVGVKRLSWEGMFPGEARSNMQFIRGNWINPDSYQAILEKWKHDKTTLNVLITGTPVNIDMYLEDYNITYTGGFGDFNYEVKFVEIISLTIITKKKTKKKSTKKTSSSSSRGTKSSGTYTVKKGDCLWNIASKKLGKGSRWKEIYNLNKSTIEKAAKKHGRKSSSNGHWIYPGTKLKLPKK